MTPTKRLDALIEARDAMTAAEEDEHAIQRINDRLHAIYTDAYFTGELTEEEASRYTFAPKTVAAQQAFRLLDLIICQAPDRRLTWLEWCGPDIGLLTGRCYIERAHGYTVLVFLSWDTRSNLDFDWQERLSQLPLWTATDFFIRSAGWNQLYRCDTGASDNEATEYIYHASRQAAATN